MLQAEVQLRVAKKKGVLKFKTKPLIRQPESEFALHSNFYPVYKGINLSPEEKQILQSITIIFESWQTWQREFFFSSLVSHYNKSQLHGLSSAVESLFHRDFMIACKNTYPMHRVQEKQHVHYCKLDSQKTFSEKSMKCEKDKVSVHNEFPQELRNKSPTSTKTMQEKVRFPELISKKKLKEKPFKSMVQLKSTLHSKSINSTENAIFPFSDSCLQTGSKTYEDDNDDSSAAVNDVEISSAKSSFVTLPSVWSMGPSTDLKDFEETESKVSLNKGTDDYFPAVLKSNCQSHYVITPKMDAFEHFMEKFNVARNKVPLPTTSQMHKNNKLWSSTLHNVTSNKIRLKELYQKQVSQIWQWINGWEDHRKTRLLLHLLSFSFATEQKFVGECIKQKFLEIKFQEEKNRNLAYEVWLKIVDYLQIGDVEKSELVCKSWNDVLINDDFWITKCNEIAKKMNVPDLVEILSSKQSGDYEAHWRETYFMLRDRGYKLTTEAQSALSLTESKEFENFETDEINMHSLSLQNFDESETGADGSLVKKQKQFKPSVFFPNFKEKLSVAQDEVKSKMQKLREEQEKLRLQEEENKKKEFRTRRLREIEEIMFKVKPLRDQSRVVSPSRSAVRFSEVPLSAKPSRAGFLHMWNTIVEDIKEKDDKNQKAAATQKIKMNVINGLLTAEELEHASKQVGFIAVDYPEEGTQNERSWHSDTYVPPVTSCIALKGHIGPVWCIIGHGKRIISGGLDRKIHFWDKLGDCYATIDDCAKGGIMCMAIGSDERCRTLYAGSWDRTITVYDSINCRKITVLTGHTDSISGLAVNSDFIASSSYDSTVRVWNVRTNQLKRVLHCHSNSILCMDLREDLVVTGGADKLVKVSDLRSGEVLREYEGHKASVTAIKIRRNLIISADCSGFLFFWALKGNTEPVFSLQAHDQQVNAITFSPKRIFTVSDDKQVKEWNLLTMRCVRVLQGHTKAVTDVKYTSDYLLTSSKDGSVRTWWWKDMEEPNEEEKKVEKKKRRKYHRLLRNKMSL